MKTTLMNTPRLLGTFIAGALLLATGGTPANAQLRPPPGLAPGERYRFVFVTSGTGDATNTDITPYDNFVSNAAVAAGLTEYQGQAVSWQ
ncbi:MAG: hypothetical protein Q8M07_32435, partial [Prosthecobacter sp.]|nr:hypothetical protein [Prosthecobacter sp.]